jgi:Tol biopolymer transport system component
VQTGAARQVFAGDAVQARWSPGGRRVAFWGLTAGGKRDILTLAPGEDAPVAVTNDWHVDWNPVWAPDGRHLYFSSDRGGSMNLWRVAIDERTGRVEDEPEPVTAGVAAFPQHLDFSADGRRMVYVANVQTANLQRFGFDPVTGSLRGSPVWVTGGSSQVWLPHVSADGEWIVYSTRGQQEDIFVVRSDGSGRRQLTSDADKDRGPRWSPDGERIVFYSNRTGSYELYGINPDGSGLEQWSDTAGLSRDQPAWSPDGSRLAYSDLQVQVSLVRPGVPVEDQEAEVLPAVDLQGGSFLVWDWSPDGRSLAGVALSQTGRPLGIVVHSLEDGTYRTLTSFGSTPVWLGDSRRLLFSDTETIYLLDTRTGEHRPVLSVSPDDLSAGYWIAPDDQSIFVSRTTNEADIWLVDLE